MANSYILNSIGSFCVTLLSESQAGRKKEWRMNQGYGLTVL